ncbi:MAG: hypothetical protein E6Q06_01915 [Candidatus Moraniibacteriota bacterium]|nr:MAG: hypothetical protein E6Q06_01915 [Candidatus Moranbacteria bacterium]
MSISPSSIEGAQQFADLSAKLYEYVTKNGKGLSALEQTTFLARTTLIASGILKSAGKRKQFSNFVNTFIEIIAVLQNMQLSSQKEVLLSIDFIVSLLLKGMKDALRIQEAVEEKLATADVLLDKNPFELVEYNWNPETGSFERLHVPMLLNDMLKTLYAKVKEDESSAAEEKVGMSESDAARLSGEKKELGEEEKLSGTGEEKEPGEAKFGAESGIEGAQAEPGTNLTEKEQLEGVVKTGEAGQTDGEAAPSQFEHILSGSNFQIFIHKPSVNVTYCKYIESESVAQPVIPNPEPAAVNEEPAAVNEEPAAVNEEPAAVNEEPAAVDGKETPLKEDGKESEEEEEPVWPEGMEPAPMKDIWPKEPTEEEESSTEEEEPWTEEEDDFFEARLLNAEALRRLVEIKCLSAHEEAVKTAPEGGNETIDKETGEAEPKESKPEPGPTEKPEEPKESKAEKQTGREAEEPGESKSVEPGETEPKESKPEPGPTKLEESGETKLEELTTEPGAVEETTGREAQEPGETKTEDELGQQTKRSEHYSKVKSALYWLADTLASSNQSADESGGKVRSSERLDQLESLETLINSWITSQSFSSAEYALIFKLIRTIETQCYKTFQDVRQTFELSKWYVALPKTSLFLLDTSIYFFFFSLTAFDGLKITAENNPFEWPKEAILKKFSTVAKALVQIAKGEADRSGPLTDFLCAAHEMDGATRRKKAMDLVAYGERYCFDLSDYLFLHLMGNVPSHVLPVRPNDGLYAEPVLKLAQRLLRLYNKTIKLLYFKDSPEPLFNEDSPYEQSIVDIKVLFDCSLEHNREASRQKWQAGEAH